MGKVARFAYGANRERVRPFFVKRSCILDVGTPFETTPDVTISVLTLAEGRDLYDPDSRDQKPLRQ